MATILLITGNANKLREYQGLIPAGSSIDLTPRELDLTEIQSLDPKEITAHKLKEAYQIAGQPVIVDDVSAGLDSLGGLPGPFVKFFMKRLGDDALYKLAGKEGEKVTITCIAGYYDGQKMVFGEGILHGTVVAPRGDNNFGFDPVIQPDGQTKTYAEMSYDEKNAISHRSLAIKDLLRQLTA